MAALSLLNVYIITKEEVYLRSAQKRLKRVLSLQSEEGWFQGLRRTGQTGSGMRMAQE